MWQNFKNVMISNVDCRYSCYLLDYKNFNFLENTLFHSFFKLSTEQYSLMLEKSSLSHFYFINFVFCVY